MIAAVYIPLWVPAAVICVLCLLPGLPNDLRNVARFIRRIRGERAHNRKLEIIWRDEEVGAAHPPRASLGGADTPRTAA